MIKAICFDLDETLLNRSESLLNFLVNQYERQLSILKTINKSVFIQRFIELDQRGYVWKDKVYTQLLQENGINHCFVNTLLEDYINLFFKSAKAFPYMHETLEKLHEKGYLMAIISNGFGSFQYRNIEALHIEKYFKKIYISEWEGIKKPDSRIFELALKELDVTASEAILLETILLTILKQLKI
ncbi:HAD family hydrolase [Alkalihalobacillus trypoxylicola]|uniref:HAD family hydrolase n=1 Tax=Alkalihalobacillus trypoxylicola TaxID=519424 RepID=UPI000AC182D9|nr:HAD-IA family hydrolase [Alkalihalobacillus trypoxylicola]